ncbi:MAG: hypothetical protein HY532_03420 [Chloroflexi bacterium]|nr:hypothetical protein [Chloroflexota bacterium]
MPTTLTFIALATTILGLAIGGAAFWGRPFRFPRAGRLTLLFLALLLVVGPWPLWAWQQATAAPTLSLADQYQAWYYSGKYGGLTLYHTFGLGKSSYNPPDELEAGGYLRDVVFTPDGSAVESFWLHTLQGKKFKFLVRPEIVPLNYETWGVEAYQVYSQCRCLVAIHFTQQPVGNVAISFFPVESMELE